MNLSESLGWMKTLKTRHSELVQLRSENSRSSTHRYGNEPPVEERPEYDVKKLDKLTTKLATEIRHLDEAIKRTNAATQLGGYVRDENILGELE